jgi:hypothetical protein
MIKFALLAFVALSAVAIAHEHGMDTDTDTDTDTDMDMMLMCNQDVSMHLIGPSETQALHFTVEAETMDYEGHRWFAAGGDDLAVDLFDDMDNWIMTCTPEYGCSMTLSPGDYYILVTSSSSEEQYYYSSYICETISANYITTCGEPLTYVSTGFFENVFGEQTQAKPVELHIYEESADVQLNYCLAQSALEIGVYDAEMNKVGGCDIEDPSMHGTCASCDVSLTMGKYYVAVSTGSFDLLAMSIGCDCEMYLPIAEEACQSEYPCSPDMESCCPAMDMLNGCYGALTPEEDNCEVELDTLMMAMTCEGDTDTDTDMETDMDTDEDSVVLGVSCGESFGGVTEQVIWRFTVPAQATSSTFDLTGSDEDVEVGFFPTEELMEDELVGMCTPGSTCDPQLSPGTTYYIATRVEDLESYGVFALAIACDIDADGGECGALVDSTTNYCVKSGCFSETPSVQCCDQFVSFYDECAANVFDYLTLDDQCTSTKSSNQIKRACSAEVVTFASSFEDLSVDDFTTAFRNAFLVAMSNTMNIALKDLFIESYGPITPTKQEGDGLKVDVGIIVDENTQAADGNDVILTADTVQNSVTNLDTTSFTAELNDELASENIAIVVSPESIAVSEPEVVVPEEASPSPSTSSTPSASRPPSVTMTATASPSTGASPSSSQSVSPSRPASVTASPSAAASPSPSASPLSACQNLAMDIDEECVASNNCFDDDISDECCTAVNTFVVNEDCENDEYELPQNCDNHSSSSLLALYGDNCVGSSTSGASAFTVFAVGVASLLAWALRV